MTISIITAVHNNKEFIADAIDSVLAQSYPYIEYIVVDGASADGTTGIIEKYGNKISKFICEPDNGIYDALNKGLKIASGDIIGFLHSDDFFANVNAVEKIAAEFTSAGVEAVYSDLAYVGRKNKKKIIRYWKAGKFSAASLKFGWMPPHPALYVRKSLYDRAGMFDTGLKIASDYDMMLKLLNNTSGKISYIEEVLVIMRLGGKSNKGLKDILMKSSEDYKTLKKNNFSFPLGTLLLKNIRKIKQFF